MTVVEHEVARPPERAPEPQVVTTADVLHRAADLLEEFGFCQHAAARTADGDEIGICDFRNDSRRRISFCQNGAIHQAVMDLGLTRWPKGLDASDLALEGPSWNDQPGRTTAEVVARLRDAAARALPQGCAS